MSKSRIKVGYVILAHQHPELVARLAKLLLNAGGLVVIHYDRNSDAKDFETLKASLESHKSDIIWPERVHVGWGEWSIVQATINSLEVLAKYSSSVDYVHLMSGSDYPIKPIECFHRYIEKNMGYEFIECADMAEESWVKGGLTHERYQFRHYFNWKKNRVLFDKSFATQKKLGLIRDFPSNLKPHMGSQWWTLSWRSIEAVLHAGRDRKISGFFKSVWIPDEMFIQSVVATHGYKRADYPNLTLYQFNDKGNPLVYHDDHVDYLISQPFFFARKISPYALKLRNEIDRLSLQNADDSVEKLTIGVRTTHYQQHVEKWAYPNNDRRLLGYEVDHWYGDLSYVTRPIVIIVGPCRSELELVAQFMKRFSGIRCHGALFDSASIQFADNTKSFAGYSINDVKLRDDRRTNFLADVVQEDPENKLICFLLPWGTEHEILDRLTWRPSSEVIFVQGSSLRAIEDRFSHAKCNLTAGDADCRIAFDKDNTSRTAENDIIIRSAEEYFAYMENVQTLLRNGYCQLTEVDVTKNGWQKPLLDLVKNLTGDIEADAAVESAETSASNVIASYQIDNNLLSKLVASNNIRLTEKIYQECANHLALSTSNQNIGIFCASDEEADWIAAIISKSVPNALINTNFPLVANYPTGFGCADGVVVNGETDRIGETLVNRIVTTVGMSGARHPSHRSVIWQKYTCTLILRGNLMRAYKEYINLCTDNSATEVRHLLKPDGATIDKMKKYKEEVETFYESIVEDCEKCGAFYTIIDLMKADWLDRLVDCLGHVSIVDKKHVSDVVTSEIENLSDPSAGYVDSNFILHHLLRGEALKGHLTTLSVSDSV